MFGPKSSRRELGIMNQYLGPKGSTLSIGRNDIPMSREGHDTPLWQQLGYPSYEAWASAQNQSISPFFIVLLLWYPAFENLFSIIRKLKLNKSALNADFKHFHQLLYLVINSKIKNKKIANNISGLIISFYNFIIFLISINYYHHTQTLIILILFSVFIYLFSYFKILSNLRR